MACPHFHFMNECRHKVCRLWKGVVITMKIPQHVAIILDGNGRWAKSKGMPRNYGHTVGAKNVETVCKAAHDMGIKYLTMYAFSTENWNRKKEEVDFLMDLLGKTIQNELAEMHSNNVVINFIGDLKKLNPKLQEILYNAVEVTKNNTGVNLQIAFNYGARDEIVHALKSIASKVKSGEMEIEQLQKTPFVKTFIPKIFQIRTC